MTKKQKIWEWAGFFWVLLAGTLLHFAYDWSGQNPVVGLFSAVNESVWEHLKLLFFPVLLFALVEQTAFSAQKAVFWRAKALGALCGMGAIVSLFYLYTGILGRSLLVVDLALFVLGAVLTSRTFQKQMQKTAAAGDALLAAVVFVGMGLLFFCFTFYPPQIGLFADLSRDAMGTWLRYRP